MSADSLVTTPLMLHPAGPLAAEYAPGGGAVDLILFPANGEPPMRVRLTGHQVQLLIVSVRTAQQSAIPHEPEPAVNPARALAARGGLSSADWLKAVFAPFLQPDFRASSSATNARISGTSSSAAIASGDGAAPSA